MDALRIVLIHDVARALLIPVVTFVLTLFIGRWWVHFARRNNIGKQIRNDGPQSHMTKMGTPTMGGVMIVIAVIVVTMLFNAGATQCFHPRIV